MGRPVEGLVGQVFGQLTVIEYAGKHLGKPYQYWLCQCSCGKRKEIDSGNLKKGTTKSCGCYRSRGYTLGPKHNLTGKVFGQLTVIEYAGNKLGNTGYFWICVCSCGQRKEIDSHSLKNGSTKSCGCFRSQPYVMGPRTDLVGQRFGKLLVVECIGLKSRKTGYNWLCECDCGGKVNVAGTRLLTGNKTSCDCEKNKLPGNTAFENNRLTTYRASAEQRGLDFPLSREIFVRLLYHDCYYCGAPPNIHYAPHGRKNREGLLPLNGVDRLDSSLGYTADNCVSCCTLCNRMKMKLGHNEFIRQCMKVAKFIKESGIKPRKRS